jgi:hypothetical protein
MTNADLQKAFDAGYAAAKALYSILQKGGIEVTEADIRRIVEEVLEETLGIKDDVKQYKMEIDTAKDYSNAHTLLDGELVRISDLSPSTNEIIGATFSYTAKGASNPTSGTVTNDTIIPFNGIFGITATGYKMLDGIFVFAEVDGINIETPGTYAARDFFGAIESTATITWKTETNHPIDQKYIPGPVEINLSEYGIDLATIAMTGKTMITVSGTKKMWEEINKSKDFVLLTAYTNNDQLRIIPSMSLYSDCEGGKVNTSVALQVQAMIGSLTNLSFIMGTTYDDVNGYGDDTTIVCGSSTL